MKPLSRACLTLTFLASASLSAQETMTVPEGFTALFNGKDLSGWVANNPHTTAKAKTDAEREKSLADQAAEFTTHWTVENGELVNDGFGAYATTEKNYGDIEFLIDYKTVALADSGIYLRGTPQVQIWDYTEEKKFKIGGDKGSGGLWNNSAGADGKDPLVLADKAFGEWNRFRIKQIGARTWVWLNDQPVVVGAIMENYWDKTRKTPLPRTGPIHLQTHGGEIRWKNIFVREIDPAEARETLAGLHADDGEDVLFNGKDLSGWAGALDSYEIVDGTITGKSGKGGTLYHENEYGDFIARLEFKVPPGGNNGLAIRYPGTGNAAYDAMTELQVLDNTAEKYSKLDPRQFHGGAYGMAAAARGYLYPVGEWNYQVVTVKGSTIRVELNGSVILDTDLSEITEYMADKAHPGKDLKTGHFGFAGHNDPVQFRKITVKGL